MPRFRDPELDPEDNERYDNEVDPDDQAFDDVLSAGARRCLGRTEALKKHLASLPHALIASRICQSIDAMAAIGLDIATLLYYLSWNLDIDSNSEDAGKIRYARTALMHCDLLPGILKKWYRLPRKHEGGIRTRAARMLMERWALDNVKMRMNRKMRLLAPLTLSDTDELTEESFLAIKLDQMASDYQAVAPITWDLLHSGASTPFQLKWNTYKNHSASVFAIINMLQYG
ncbi:hypothetical protein BC835DRAFT_1416808 [Cytidiella melzeri]|nr:hypothetical protein BC835DRAFT_1416808 [Cytidiella melzeri]